MNDDENIVWRYKIRTLGVQQGTVSAPDRKSAQKEIKSHYRVNFWIYLHPEGTPIRQWNYVINKRNNDPSGEPTKISGSVDAASEMEARNEVLSANWTEKDRITIDIHPA
ncbi:MAG: hypothetical protein LBV45_10805 [Xanthomonadaceae bacterium]|nr:hypothetical protein [Xanthomonadaceae bacterium]